MSQQSNRGWIGVDLDGTLAHYDRWRGPEHIGKPIEAMVLRVRRWLAEGQPVKIFTARVADGDPEMIKRIQEWCELHIGIALPVTNVKDYGMIALWDDRAVQVILNTGKPVWSGAS